MKKSWPLTVWISHNCGQNTWATQQQTYTSTLFQIHSAVQGPSKIKPNNYVTCVCVFSLFLYSVEWKNEFKVSHFEYSKRKKFHSPNCDVFSILNIPFCMACDRKYTQYRIHNDQIGPKWQYTSNWNIMYILHGVN